jgi:NADH dehydrogenase FAD-containing subunit
VLANIQTCVTHHPCLGACCGLQSLNERVKGAKRVLIVGGGSLGVELAGEILTDHPTVKVTLVQSQDTLLPDMPPKAGAAALWWLQKHGCEVSGSSSKLGSVLSNICSSSRVPCASTAQACVTGEVEEVQTTTW